MYVTGIGLVFSGIFYFCVHERDNPNVPKCKNVPQTQNSKNPPNETPADVESKETTFSIPNGGHLTKPQNDKKVAPNTNKSVLWNIQEHGCMSSSLRDLASLDGPKSIKSTSKNASKVEAKLDEVSSDVKGEERGKKKYRHWKQWLKESHFYQVSVMISIHVLETTVESVTLLSNQHNWPLLMLKPISPDLVLFPDF